MTTLATLLAVQAHALAAVGGFDDRVRLELDDHAITMCEKDPRSLKAPMNARLGPGTTVSSGGTRET